MAALYFLSHYAYIGMIGSKKRAAAVKEAVLETGCSPEVLSNVRSPIGLDIGAETPEEIAVAIMAELIQSKNREKRGGGYPKEILNALLHPAVPGIPAVLATIVTRKGSSPREIGTKMLIWPDGSCIGTIGGGCMEAGLLTEARRMLSSKEPKAKLCPIDMTGAQAEEDGMICGGRIEVLLEMILPETPL